MKEWFLTFHLIGFLIYGGGLLNLSRLLGYHVKEEPEVRARLSRMEKRMYFFVTMPGLAILLVFGLLLLFGVGQEHVSAVESYLRPRNEAGEKNLWYVTFHAKLLFMLVLLVLDVYMGRQILHLARTNEAPPAWKFKALHGSMALVMIVIVTLVKAGPLKA